MPLTTQDRDGDYLMVGIVLRPESWVMELMLAIPIHLLHRENDGLLMTFKRFSFTVDTKRGIDMELEIGRRSDGELDTTDGELNPEVLFKGLAQEETVWPKFIVESSSNNFKNSA
ncbi:hypothetical protein FQA39_LY03741 [Lamprigera yunnana]|nr:hypothetical protein FQA39_LY03741 [Lamprigera yunnana]